MEYFAYKGYTIIYNTKRNVYLISPFNKEFKTLKSAKAWINYLNL